MKAADEILDDEELIDLVYEALRRRRPQSATRGRKGTPAEVALRMLVLKHMRNWSFEIVEREVRANLVYRMFTRVGAEKVPDAEDAKQVYANYYDFSQHVDRIRQGDRMTSITITEE